MCKLGNRLVEGLNKLALRLRSALRCQKYHLSPPAPEDPLNPSGHRVKTDPSVCPEPSSGHVTPPNALNLPENKLVTCLKY